MASRKLRREREGALEGRHEASQRVLVHVDHVVRSKLFGHRDAGPARPPAPGAIPEGAKPLINPITGVQVIDPATGHPAWLVPLTEEEAAARESARAAAPPAPVELDPEVAAMVEAYLAPRALPLIEALEAVGATAEEQRVAMGALLVAAGEHIAAERAAVYGGVTVGVDASREGARCLTHDAEGESFVQCYGDTPECEVVTS